MAYSRKQIILKSKTGYIVATLESNGGKLAWSLSKEIQGELMLFKSEATFLNMGSRKSGYISSEYGAHEFAAAAILEHGSIVFSGSSRNFNWDLAKKNIMPKAHEKTVEKVAVDEMPDEKEESAANMCKLNRKVFATSAFDSIFPNAKWYKVEYEGANWHYLIGEIYENGTLSATAVCVPGRYNKYPPKWLDGFWTFVPSGVSNSGYWISMKTADGKRISGMRTPLI